MMANVTNESVLELITTGRIRIAWGDFADYPQAVALGTFDAQGTPGSIILVLDDLDKLLDMLHQARPGVAGTKRIARMLRLPVNLKNRLEAKVRREGGNQNAAIIEAIEHYLAE